MSERNRFVAPAILISSLTLVSRVLGLCRESALSYFFGAAPILSSFRLAFQIPNLARRSFGEGALSAAFIPVFTDCLHREGDESARRLVGAVLTLLVIVLVCLTGTIEVGVYIAYRLRPGMTLALTAILLPYMILVCVTALLGGVLHVLRHFAAPAAAPALLNVVIVVSAIVGGSVVNLPAEQLVFVIATAIVGAGFAQVGLQVWIAWRLKFRPVFNANWRDPNVRRITALMGPMILGMSAVQINTFADSLIAFLLVPDGRGLAILGYAQYLYQFPLGLFGVALASAIFPVLSSLATQGDRSEFTRTVERGLRMSLFVALPSMVGLIFVATPLVTALYERGEFRPDDTVRVARSLVFYTLGLWAYCSQHILVRAFYAVKDSTTPARLAAGMIVLNLTLNLVLVFRLREAGVALATAISATIQIVLLVRAIHPRLDEPRWGDVASGTLRMSVAAAAMGAAVWAASEFGGLGETWAVSLPLRIGAIVVGGAVVYVGCCYVLRVGELSDAWASVLSRRRSSA